jgi:protein ImuA
MGATSQALDTLRALIGVPGLGGSVQAGAGETGAAPIALGHAGLDAAMDGGLLPGHLHDVHPAGGGADLGAATAFALGLALRMAAGKPILVISQSMLDGEAGRLYPPGLAEFGIDPGRLILARADNAEEALRMLLEGARCTALGSAVAAFWGEPRFLDLTATRRLLLAAGESATSVFLVRGTPAPGDSAARTRWLVRPAPSRALMANAPGSSAFDVMLARQRGGVAGASWRMEWDRDQQSFRDGERKGHVSGRVEPRAEPAAPLSRPLPPLPPDRQAAA